jgi:hypothetical protein
MATIKKTSTISADILNGKTWLEYIQSFNQKITEKEADYILWNETCYPFDTEIAVQQVKQYFTAINSQS